MRLGHSVFLIAFNLLLVQVLGRMFGVCKGTVSQEIHHCVTVMRTVLQGEIQWPTDAQLIAMQALFRNTGTC